MSRPADDEALVFLSTYHSAVYHSCGIGWKIYSNELARSVGNWQLCNRAKISWVVVGVGGFFTRAIASLSDGCDKYPDYGYRSFISVRLESASPVCSESGA